MQAYRKLPLHPSLKVAPRTHREQVKSLYKKSIQQIENHYGKYGVLEVRYRLMKLRKEFDKYKDLKDMRKIKELMDAQTEAVKPMYGEEPIKYPFSENGIAWQREFSVEDAVLDHWHPYQKAKYPEFFAKREEMKEEYLKLYEETYGNLLKGLHIERHETYGLLPHDYDEEAEKLKLEGKDPKRIGSTGEEATKKKPAEMPTKDPKWQKFFWI